MIFQPLKPIAGAAFFAFLLSFALPWQTASANSEVLGSRILSESILDGDAGDGDPTTNSHFLFAEFDLWFFVAFGEEINDTFRVAYELRDENGVAVTWQNPEDPLEPTIAYSEEIEVELTWNVSGPNSENRNVFASTVPGETLITARRYRAVALRVEMFDGIDWIEVPDSVSATAEFEDLHLFHFTNTDGNDPALNVRGHLSELAWIRDHLVATDENRDSFRALVSGRILRYDEFADFPSGGVDEVTIRLAFELIEESTGDPVALENDGIVEFEWQAPPHDGSTSALPTEYFLFEFVDLRPAAGIQLASASETYILRCTLLHIETPPDQEFDNGNLAMEARRLLHFNGEILFGSRLGMFSQISNFPFANAPVSGGVPTSLEVPLAAGTLVGTPDVYWGGGGAFEVLLRDDGVSVFDDPNPLELSGFYDLPSLTLPQGTRLSYGSVTLDSNGVNAQNARAEFPQGLCLLPDTTSQGWIGQGHHDFPGTVSLDANLLPSLPVSVTLGPDAAVSDESHPLRFTTTGFTIQSDGSIVFDTTGVEYIHRESFDLLDAYTLNGPEMRDRMSNDRYWLNVSGSGPVTWTAAADGSARMHAILELTDVGFTTHFPQGTAITSADPVDLEIENGRHRTDSRMSVASVSTSYFSSCATDACMQGAPPEQVAFSPASSRLLFTPGGGLANSGTVPGGTTLVWGVRGSDGNNDPLYAHRTDSFTAAEFLMPGYHLYAEDNPVAADPAYQTSGAFLAPSVLLDAAYDRGGGTWYAYGSVGHRDGLGSFAGLTFTVDAPGRTGASRLAGSTTDYAYELLDLAANPDSPPSKYYVRPSGVSGRQVAKDGTYSGSLDLYGYGFDLTSFQLTFLSNENRDSWVNGGVTVGGEAPDNYTEFTQLFKGLRLSCLGELEGAEIDPADTSDKDLRYWNGSFSPQSIRFTTSEIAPGTCPKAYEGTLLLGVTTRVAHVPADQVLISGILAFRPNGNMSTMADPAGDEAIDSQLSLWKIKKSDEDKIELEKTKSVKIEIDGPKGKPYKLATVGKLRFSNPEAAGPDAPLGGFVTFPGKLTVPYFRALEVQVITSANSSPAAPLFLTPGWNNGGTTFFNREDFDASHRGFPTGISFAEFTSPTPATDPAYLLHAEQDMFGVVPLSYPLKWDDSARRFASMAEVEQELFITTMPHRVEWMDAKFTNLSFGKSYENMPVATLDSLRNNSIGSLFDSFTPAIGVPSKQILARSFDEFDQLLADNLDPFVREMAQRVVRGGATPTAIQSLETDYQATLAAMVANPDFFDTFHSFRSELLDQFDLVEPALKSEIEAAAAALLIDETRDALEHIILGIDVLIFGVDFDVSGDPVFERTLPESPPLSRGLLYKEAKRVRVEKLVEALILNTVTPDVKKVLKPLIKDSDSAMKKELARLLKDADPAFDRIVANLKDIREQLATVHDGLAASPATGPVRARLNALIARSASNGEVDNIIAGLRAQVAARIDATAASLAISSGEPMFLYPGFVNEFGGTPFLDAMQTGLGDALAASGLARHSRYLIHQLAYDPQVAFTAAAQSTLDRINEVTRGAIFSGVGILVNDRFNPIAGALEKYVGTGDLNGYAEFNGDSLRKLRFDAMLKLKLKEDLKLKGWMEILCYSSEDNFVDNGCITDGDKMVEVRAGAKDVKLDWFLVAEEKKKDSETATDDDKKKGKAAKGDLSLKVSLKKPTDSTIYRPINFGGGFKLTSGELSFEGVKIKKLGAAIAIGADESYLGAKAKAKFPGTEYDLGIGFFVGRTCTLDPIKTVDSDVADVLTAGNVYTGIYLYGEVWIPVSEVLLGIKPTCLFRVDAGIGAGWFAFAEENLNATDPQDREPNAVVGIKMFLGVSGEALCVVTIRGEVKMVGAYKAGALVAAGTGKISGSLGWCPVCVEFAAQIKIKYVAKDDKTKWTIDY